MKEQRRFMTNSICIWDKYLQMLEGKICIRYMNDNPELFLWMRKFVV